MTTSPSYTAPLAALLNVPAVEAAGSGYQLLDLLTYLGPRSEHLIASNAVLLCGINDVLQGVSAVTIEARLTTVMAQLQNPVVVTLLPFGNYTSWDAGKEAVRVSVNAWIAANVAHYVDAESVMGTAGALKAEYDSGDGLHPNDEGNTALAGAIFAQGFNSEALA